MKKLWLILASVLVCMSLVVGLTTVAVATPKPTTDSFVTNHFRLPGAGTCSKCGLELFGTVGEQSTLAVALGLTLCAPCWWQILYGNDFNTSILSVAQLGEDGKVLATQLPTGQGGITGEGLDAVFTSNGLLKRTGTATYTVDTNTYVTGTPWTGMGYLTANQSISLGGILSGSGTTSITASAASGYYMPSTTDQTTWNGKLSAVTGTALDNVFSTNGLLKRTGVGTYTLDSSAYITGNQSITLSGDLSGSGTTSISGTVNGIKGTTLPALSAGYLYYSGSAWAFQTPAGGSNPAWYGKLYSTRSDCNPITQTEHENMLSVAAPTPTNITVSLARCVQFTPPANITVSSIRLFGVGITTNLYKFAIYPVGTSTVKVWDSGTVTTAANTWLNLTTGLPVTLTAGTKYWWCVTAVAIGTVAGFRSEPAPLGTNYWGANAAPLGGTSLGLPVYAQFAVSTGVFPTNLPTIAAAAYSGGTTGTIPAGYLDYGGAK
jgi:hypothetical protein